MRLSTVPLAALAAVGAAVLRPAIRLRPESVEVPVAPDAVVERFRDRIVDHADVIASDGDVVVARFSGRAGVFEYRTVETVRFASEAVRFHHLDGPFAECDEEFTLERTSRGTSVVHGGHFRMPYGLAGWVFGVLAARPAFERHVAVRMAAMPEEMTARPTR